MFYTKEQMKQSFETDKKLYNSVYGKYFTCRCGNYYFDEFQALYHFTQGNCKQLED